MKTYQVEVCRLVPVFATISVEAETIDAALDQARIEAVTLSSFEPDWEGCSTSAILAISDGEYPWEGDETLTPETKDDCAF